MSNNNCQTPFSTLSITEKDGEITFKCRVQPGASKSAISSLYGDSLKISLSAPAVEGKANQELIKFLGKTFNIPKNSVSILSGETSRSKLVRCLTTKKEFISILKNKL